GAPGINFTIQMSGPLNTEGTPPHFPATNVNQHVQAVGLAAQQVGQSVGQASAKSTAVAAAPTPTSGPTLPTSLVAAFLSQPVQPAALTQPAAHPSNPVQQVTINPQPLPPGGSVAKVITTTQPAGALTKAVPKQPIVQGLLAPGLNNVLS